MLLGHRGGPALLAAETTAAPRPPLLTARCRAAPAPPPPPPPAAAAAARRPLRRRRPVRARAEQRNNNNNTSTWTSASDVLSHPGAGAHVLDPVWDVLNKSTARTGSSSSSSGGGGDRDAPRGASSPSSPSSRRTRSADPADAAPASPADRKTKVVCTIGPATDTRDRFFALADAGMDVVRCNMSHGSHASHRAVIDLAREYNARVRAGKGGRAALGLLLDTRGPEVRSGDLQEPLSLAAGDALTFTRDPSANGRDGRVGVNYGEFSDDVDVGDELLVDGGIMTFRVAGIDRATGDVRCETVDGGVLGSRRHLNVRGRSANLPALTDKDMDDLKFGLEEGVDYYALSFVRDAQVLKDVKAWLAQNGGARIRVLAKIESADSVRCLDRILDAADGAMVARGDLGAEMPIADVPWLQNRIIDGCRRRGKPVICATNMLESMIEDRPVPTRAEVSDIAIAVREGADAVMLSGETAYGRYPLRAVATMSAVAAVTEGAMARYSGARRFGTDEAAPIGWVAPPGRRAGGGWGGAGGGARDAGSGAGAGAGARGGGRGGGGGGPGSGGSGSTGAAALSELMAFHSVTIGDTAGFPLLVFSRTGGMPALLSHYRPHRPVFCFTDSCDVQQRLSLYHGVVPLFMPGLADMALEDAVDGAMAELLSRGLLRAKEHVAVVQSGRRPIWRAPSTHGVQLRRAERRHARAARALRAARQLGSSGATNLESAVFDADERGRAAAAHARAPSFDGGALSSFGGGASGSLNTVGLSDDDDEDDEDDEDWDDDDNVGLSDDNPDRD